MENRCVLKDFLKYVSFNILGQMAFSCYTLADTYFVSAKLGANGLTALNLAFPLFCLISGTGLMIGMGGGTKYSICKGRGEQDRANTYFTTALCLLAAAAAVYILCGVFFLKAIVRLLGADDTVFPLVYTYLRVMLLFAPAFLINHVLQCFIRNDGNPLLSMAALITGSLSNVVLDYIFIFPMNMGIFGAILATSLAPVISIMVLSPYLLRRRNGFHVVAAALYKENMGMLRHAGALLSCGVPFFLTEATSGIVMFVFNVIILRIAGNVGVAAFGVVTVISLVVVAVYTGLSQGTQPVISRNYGIGRAENVNAALRYAMLTMLLLSAAIYSVVYFGADILTLLFNKEANGMLQAYAVKGLRLYFAACPFMGWNIVLATYFTSTEKPRPAQLISLLRGLIVLIPMVCLLSFRLNMTGVWIAYPLTEGIVALIGGVLYAVSKRRKMKAENGRACRDKKQK